MAETEERVRASEAAERARLVDQYEARLVAAAGDAQRREREAAAMLGMMQQV